MLSRVTTTSPHANREEGKTAVGVVEVVVVVVIGVRCSSRNVIDRTHTYLRNVVAMEVVVVVGGGMLCVVSSVF